MFCAPCWIDEQAARKGSKSAPWLPTTRLHAAIVPFVDCRVGVAEVRAQVLLEKRGTGTFF